MKNIELQIKPALLLLLHDKWISEDEDASFTENGDLIDSRFYEWLLQEKLISKMEYDRLIKEE